MDRVIKVGIVVAIVGIVAYFGYSLFSNWHKQSLENAKRQERVEWEKRTKELMEKVLTAPKRNRNPTVSAGSDKSCISFDRT